MTKNDWTFVILTRGQPIRFTGDEAWCRALEETFSVQMGALTAAGRFGILLVNGYHVNSLAVDAWTVHRTEPDPRDRLMDLMERQTRAIEPPREPWQADAEEGE